MIRIFQMTITHFFNLASRPGGATVTDTGEEGAGDRGMVPEPPCECIRRGSLNKMIVTSLKVGVML